MPSISFRHAAILFWTFCAWFICANASFGKPEFKIIKSFGSPDRNGNPPSSKLTVGPDGRLYGVTLRGGLYNEGTLYAITPEGQGYQTLFHFGGESQAKHPAGELTISPDGWLYGTTSSSSTSGFHGTVYRLHPTSLSMEVIKVMDGHEAASGNTGVIEGSDGMLYGIANGAHTYTSFVFKVAKDGSGYKILHKFAYQDPLRLPHSRGPLREGSDGFLYGTCFEAGTYGGGVLFKIAKDGSRYQNLKHFGGSDPTPRHPVGGVIEGSDGMLYGMLQHAPGATNETEGAIYRISRTGTNYRILHTFSLYTLYRPLGELVEGADGRLYGAANIGNRENGGVFAINKDGSGFVSLLGTALSEYPSTALIQLSSGRLFGVAQGEGSANGLIYGLDPDGDNAVVLHQFSYTGGAAVRPRSLLAGKGQWIYGITEGENTSWPIFYKIRRDGTGYTPLREFSPETVVGEKTAPQSLSTLDLEGNILAGAYLGGTKGGGALIRLSPSGNYEYVSEFAAFGQGTGPSSPSGVIQLPNGSLIGLSFSGGNSNNGTIYRLDPGSSEPLILHHFAGWPSDIRSPIGMPLLASDGKIYGISLEGVFRINPDGTGYSFRALFGVRDDPPTDLVPGYGSLVEGDDGALYGTAVRGGPSFWGGGLYRVEKEGFTISTIHAFTPEGTAPYVANGTLLKSAGFLYGYTEQGGLHGDGVLYRIKPDGKDFEILHHFAFAPDNGVGVQEIILGSEGAIYGVLRGGGAHELGALFRYGEEVKLPPQLTVLRTDGSTLSNGEVLDLGTHEMVFQHAHATLYLRNDGSEPLSLANFHLDETDSAFVITPPAQTLLAPGESTPLDISFQIHRPGTYTATARWETNDPEAEHFTLPLRVFVDGVWLVLYDGPDENAPEIFPSQELPGIGSVDLGTVRRGEPLARDFRVANLGTRELAFAATMVNPEHFRLSPAMSVDMPAFLPPGGSLLMRIERDTTVAPGFRLLMVSLLSNDYWPKITSLNISSEVLDPEIDIAVQRSPEQPFLSLVHEDTIQRFPSTLLGSSSPLPFRVSNQGNAPLVLQGWNLPAGFALEAPPSFPLIIAPGEAQPFTVILEGHELGYRTGWVEIANDDFDESPFRFQIEGWVIAPEIAVYDGAAPTAPELISSQTASVDFGETRLGTSVTRSFAIQSQALPSDDVLTLVVSEISVPSGFSLHSDAPFPNRLDSGTGTTFTVSLDATQVGTYSGSITIKNNDPDEAEFTFPITGSVTAPEIAVHNGPDTAAPELFTGQTEPVDFGRVIQGTVGGSAARALTLANTGTAPLLISSITVPEGFELLAETEPTLAPGAAATWTLRLTSIEVRTHTGVVRILSDDPDEPEFVFPVTGEIYIPAPSSTVMSPETRLNRQTGLREQIVRLTNDTTATVPGYRVIIGGLPEGVSVANASAVLPDGRFVVWVKQPLQPFSSFEVVIEYASSNRQATSVNPVISTEVVLTPPDDSSPPGNTGTFAIEHIAWLPEDGGLLLEFRSTLGQLYTVEYSEDGKEWHASPASVRATGNRTPWIDRGPPRTASPPQVQNLRFYRVRVSNP